MLPALIGIGAKALLPSSKKVDANKLLDKKKGSAIERAKDQSKEKNAPIVKKTSISSSSLLKPSPSDSSGKLAVSSSKGGALVKKPKNTVDSIVITLVRIQDLLKNENKIDQKQEEQKIKIRKKEKAKKSEEDLERKDGFSFTMPKIKVPNVPFMDQIMKFFGNILIGSLVLFIYKNIEEIIKFFQETFLKIKEFFKLLEPFIKPIWEGMKWIVDVGANTIAKILGIPSQEADTNGLRKNLEEIAKKIPVVRDLFEGIQNTIDSIRGYKEDTGSEPELPSAVPPIQGGGSDFWTLVAVVSQEDGDPQGRADVAQSIYNRLASGAYSGKNIRDLILAKWQFEPTWRYPNGPKRGSGTPNSEWFNITDAKSAGAAAGMSEGAMKSVASQILNPTLQKNAAQFVQGRTDFTGYSKSQRKSQIQRKSGDNYFGWDWNYQGNRVASVPNFGAQVAGQPAQQKQQVADVKAQTAASQAQAPAPSATPTAQVATTPTTIPQVQVSSVQPASPVVESFPQITQQADYEIPSQASLVVPLPIGSNNASGGSSGRGGVVPVGISRKEALNSYYQSQLIGFLYKQG